jgi:putative ABC transport system substrate-binding protein
MKKAAVPSILIAVVLVAVAVIAEAQPKKVPRIGYLGGSTSRIDAFRQGLRELGYVEGKNIVIEGRRFTEEKPDRIAALAVELARLKVDVIVTSGSNSTVPPRKQLLRFQLSWRRIPILSGTGSSPSLLGRAGTSRDYQTLAPS